MDNMNVKVDFQVRWKIHLSLCGLPMEKDNHPGFKLILKLIFRLLASIIEEEHHQVKETKKLPHNFLMDPHKLSILETLIKSNN